MTAQLRKLILTAHVTSSVGWIGAAAAFLVLSIAGLASKDVQVVRGASFSMNLISLYMIVPLSLAALVTGLIQSLGTQWGLFKHYWVLVKFLLTVLSIAVLLLHQFTAVARAAKLVSDSAAGTFPEGFVLLRASGLGILVLIVATALSVYKPWGLTPYGKRKQRMPFAKSRPQGVAVWLAAGIAVFIMVLLVSMHLSGHGLHHSH